MWSKRSRFRQSRRWLRVKTAAKPTRMRTWVRVWSKEDLLGISRVIGKRMRRARGLISEWISTDCESNTERA